MAESKAKKTEEEKVPMYVLVNWNKPDAGLLGFPYPDPEKAENIDNPIETNMSLFYLTLGYNEVPQEIWELVCDQTSIKKKLRAGTLSVLKDEEKYLYLTDLPFDEASDVIQNTYHLETLESYKSKVASSDLRLLILNQIEEVDKTKKSA